MANRALSCVIPSEGPQARGCPRSGRMRNLPPFSNAVRREGNCAIPRLAPLARNDRCRDPPDPLHPRWSSSFSMSNLSAASASAVTERISSIELLQDLPRREYQIGHQAFGDLKITFVFQSIPSRVGQVEDSPHVGPESERVR